MSIFERTKDWYKRYERPISSFSLISGFIFDAITLKRVDMLWENIWIFLHIVIVGIFIALIHIQENDIGDEKNPNKRHFWYVNILQFFFGGLLSTFLVFYFRSTDIFATWPFLLILTIAFIANESLKRSFMILNFQISLFFISIYSFLIFLMPVILHKIDSMVFLLSGFISIILIFLFLYFLSYFTKNYIKKDKKIVFISIFSIFIFINFLYYTNLIPPIPLSLKDAGIYNLIEKNTNGSYTIKYEDFGWEKYFKLFQNFKKVPGSPVYAYSAIFSPSKLNITVIHEWQYYDIYKKKWITDATISLPVIGGRDGGFRTYSRRSNLDYGKWRVNIKTKGDQIIGRIRFKVLKTEIIPILINDTK